MIVIDYCYIQQEAQS